MPLSSKQVRFLVADSSDTDYIKTVIYFNSCSPTLRTYVITLENVMSNKHYKQDILHLNAVAPDIYAKKVFKITMWLLPSTEKLRNPSNMLNIK